MNLNTFSHKGARFLYMAVLLCASNILFAQKPAVYSYGVYGYGDTTHLYVESVGGLQHQYYEDSYAGKKTIPGFAHTDTYVDMAKDSVWVMSDFGDEVYCNAGTVSNGYIQWDTQRVDRHTLLFVTHINSNRLEFEVTDKYGEDLSPMVSYGRLPGVLTKMRRNGQVYMELKGVAKAKNIRIDLGSIAKAKRVSGRELNNIKQQKMIITTRVFDSVQLNWRGDLDFSHAAWNRGNYKATQKSFPYDTVIHFAGGTVALKRIRIDPLPEHYQLFAELHQHSNGDAYDRTGSIFIIPQGREHTFFEGMWQHPDSLPLIKGKDGQRYQGIVATDDYLPIVELVRFFTPFGVRHFNDRVQLEGLEWEDEAYYKQEITDLMPMLQGEVWVGAFIGNYDGGGHIVSLDLKAYPNSDLWEFATEKNLVMPLFSTCNVLEMGGQNYGKLFGTDTLRVEFDIPEGYRSIRLRYICTGHGGWGTGDEFVPKQSEIVVDSKERFLFTPWRSDCGTFREFNPVSGNFWNGTSSSDYSRSGWCPGTATQPAYFDLSGLEPGHHVLTLSIPQGAPVEGGFSHWNASGTLILER